MQRFNRVCLASVMLAALLASSTFAQPPGRRDRGGPPDGGERGGPPGGRGGPGGPPGMMMMRMMPVLVALDADHDGVISKAEIENATVALQKLDKNSDGDLTEEELRPDFAAMRGGPGGFGGGPGGRGRPPQEGGRESERPEGGRPEGSTGGGGNAQAMVDRFMQFDKNSDGKLSKDELSERMQNVITRADKNGDGVASREELTAMASAMGGDGPGRGGPGGPPGGEGRGRGGDPVQFANRIFDDRDANKDGKLSGDEIPEQMAGRLAQIDSDKDGTVSRKELETSMSRLRGQGRPGGDGGRGRGDDAGGQRPRRPEAE